MTITRFEGGTSVGPVVRDAVMAWVVTAAAGVAVLTGYETGVVAAVGSTCWFWDGAGSPVVMGRTKKYTAAPRTARMTIPARIIPVFGIGFFAGVFFFISAGFSVRTGSFT